MKTRHVPIHRNNCGQLLLFKVKMGHSLKFTNKNINSPDSFGTGCLFVRPPLGFLTCLPSLSLG